MPWDRNATTDRHKKKTAERFGGYIDKYKLQDAVDDGATLQILYEGKTADTAINQKYQFDTKFENLFRRRGDEEILAIKKKYGAVGDLLEAERRIEAIAADMVDHYVEHILPSGFKAQVVCHSKLAAVHYRTYIDQAIAGRLASERAGEQTQSREELIRKLAFLKCAVIVSADSVNEKAVVTMARRHARGWKAVDNFTKPFDYHDPEKELTGIAFLIVCDMLLTGFDAPIEQVMYIDKRVKEHNLLQTIARVNRVYKGKQRGYIVDYIGLAHHLTEALAIYAAEDRLDIEASLRSVLDEVPILEQRYQRLLHLFEAAGVAGVRAFAAEETSSPKTTFLVMEQAIEKMEEIKLRADFEVYYKKFLTSMDVVLPNSAAGPYKLPAKRFGYLLSKTRERYKDHSLNLGDAGEKVKRLINEHLISLGVNPQIPPIELFADNFLQELEKHAEGSHKAKASEMAHAVRKHCKVRWDEDPAFYKKLSEKLEQLIRRHQENWQALCLELERLREEAMAGREEGAEGLSKEQSTFYDHIADLAFGDGGVPRRHVAAMKGLMAGVVEELQQTIGIVNFWGNAAEVKKLRGKLTDHLLMSGVAEIAEAADLLTTEITALAKKRHQELVK